VNLPRFFGRQPSGGTNSFSAAFAACTGTVSVFVTSDCSGFGGDSWPRAGRASIVSNDSRIARTVRMIAPLDTAASYAL
jgi:hypothetical protein